MLKAAQLVDDLVSHGRHRFGESLQRRDVLKRFRLGDERAFAVQAKDEPFLLQIAKRLADRDAADAERLA